VEFFVIGATVKVILQGIGAIPIYLLELREIITLNYICIYEMAQEKLRLACNSMGITFSKQHNAKRDAIACANIFLKLNSQ